MARKFVAEVVYTFYGETEEEVKTALKRFYAQGAQNLEGQNVASFPYSPQLNNPVRVEQQIVGKLVHLSVNYNYSEEEINDLLAGLLGEWQSELEQYYRESQAEMEYERMKEELYLEEARVEFDKNE